MRVLLPDNPRGDALKRAPTTDAAADAILDILKKYKTIAVVGLSSNPMRPSYGVTEYMQSAGYRIIPVNPNETEVLGEKSYARLEDVPEKIDFVNVFRRAVEVPNPKIEVRVVAGVEILRRTSSVRLRMTRWVNKAAAVGASAKIESQRGRGKTRRLRLPVMTTARERPSGEMAKSRKLMP